MKSQATERVVLYAPRGDAADFDGRIHLSRGTCRAETIEPGIGDRDAPPYVGDAYVSASEWRLPTGEDNLWSMTPPPTHQGVGLVRLLSPSLVRLFAARSDIFSRPDDADTLRHPLVTLLLDIAAKAGLLARDVHSARIGRDEPGRITMTKAVGQDARIGLHFDRWDQCAFDDLHAGTNRISINLGPNNRYFIFINQTAAGMAALLERAGIAVARDVVAVGKAFMAAFPDHPVLRVRLSPGDAYIAPTENILHDGSSIDVANVNHYLSLRGHFDFA